MIGVLCDIVRQGWAVVKLNREKLLTATLLCKQYHSNFDVSMLFHNFLRRNLCDLFS